ncbi:SH3 domain-containing protein [Maribacter confluentis]|uniref:SH3 domain-containing protein n=1 Tax=Maribacter confluentis TaxID=1656093 RepID=A0ABT8RX29_9FLAO|nr:SH3 domain-containing protein [Maribacter confluentis]MDO1514772.1 SH3 domain-containing protein [Maribacter confluentis]
MGILAIAAMLAFVILYILFYFSNYSTRKRWTFIGSLLALFVSLVAIVFAYIQQSDFNAWQPAIIFAEESVIKSEPNTAGQQLFILHSGTKVNVLDELEQWNKIQLTDGKTGWANKEDLRLLKDF